MSAITTTFGAGGANLTPSGSAGSPSLADALRDVADDLAGLKPAAVASAAAVAVATADADATYGAPEQTLINELKTVVNSLVTLCNEMRTRLNNLNGYTVKTTKG